MNLHKCYLTKNLCYTTGTPMAPKGIIVHSTGCNNPWLKRYVQPDDGLLGENTYGTDGNQPKPGGRKVCVHAMIGKLKDGTIATYQTLPWDMVGWHCGKANNLGYIGFEICEDGLTDEKYFKAVYKEAVELVGYLCYLYNLDPSKEGVVIDHKTAYEMGIGTRHVDVSHWFPKFGKSIDTFRDEVIIELNRLKNKQNENNNPFDEGEEDMTQEQFNKMMDSYLATKAKEAPSGWAVPYLEWAAKTGILAGDANGNLMAQSFITREQTATMFKSFYDKMVNADK